MDTLVVLWAIAKMLAPLVAIAAVAGLWIWTLAEVLRREWATSGERVSWLLVVLLLPVLGLLLYRVLVPAPTARRSTR